MCSNVNSGTSGGIFPQKLRTRWLSNKEIGTCWMFPKLYFIFRHNLIIYVNLDIIPREILTHRIFLKISEDKPTNFLFFYIFWQFWHLVHNKRNEESILSDKYVQILVLFHLFSCSEPDLQYFL